MLQSCRDGKLSLLRLTGIHALTASKDAPGKNFNKSSAATMVFQQDLGPIPEDRFIVRVKRKSRLVVEHLRTTLPKLVGSTEDDPIEAWINEVHIQQAQDEAQQQTSVKHTTRKEPKTAERGQLKHRQSQESENRYGNSNLNVVETCRVYWPVVCNTSLIRGIRKVFANAKAGFK